MDVKRVGKRATSVTDNGRSNFYPITWRVIGGGVLMSGSRKDSLSHSSVQKLITPLISQGDVCQAFLAGRCNEGLDCRFSHPSISDELEHPIVYVPPPSAEPYFPLADQWSPVSPLCISPFTVSHMVPPSPITEDGHEDIAEKLPTTDTLVSRPACKYLPIRVLLDGNTLSPRDPLSSDDLDDDDGSSPLDNSTSPESSLEDNIGARGIIRPVSTPPYTSPPTVKVVRLFAAEMP
ncbi:hypothetical protein EIP86_010957 [Pleurotus ostreatoroseus]|nr:hypothetical protein EIP86_010957 [Pleurotus ostreatoroseus]